MIPRVPSTQARPVQSSATSAGSSGAAENALEILKSHGRAVESYLTSLRARYTAGPSRLLDAIEYSLMAGGKRLRPALVLETARACGASPDNRSALAAAGAIELIHTF